MNQTALKKLPAPTSGNGPPIWSVVASRRSVRAYDDTAMPIEALSQLLWAVQGITGTQAGTELRASPSAGACYPIETYVVANRVTGLDEGLYRYLVGEHALLLERKGDVGREITAAALGQQMCAEASVTVVWTAVVRRTTARYGNRGLRYIYMDAGHVGQNTYLAATALGYGCCTIGAFDDNKMNQAIGADGKQETTIYAASVGPSR